jgi:hypothetical protein
VNNHSQSGGSPYFGSAGSAPTLDTLAITGFDEEIDYEINQSAESLSVSSGQFYPLILFNPRYI